MLGLQCDAGSYSNQTGAQTCILCERGKFQPSRGASTCFPCAEGSASTAVGQVSCAECDRGTYGDRVAGRCLDCPGIKPLCLDSNSVRCPLASFVAFHLQPVSSSRREPRPSVTFVRQVRLRSSSLYGRDQLIERCIVQALLRRPVPSSARAAPLAFRRRALVWERAWPARLSPLQTCYSPHASARWVMACAPRRL